MIGKYYGLIILHDYYSGPAGCTTLMNAQIVTVVKV